MSGEGEVSTSRNDKEISHSCPRVSGRIEEVLGAKLEFSIKIDFWTSEFD
jgi:hypothetical protein